MNTKYGWYSRKAVIAGCGHHVYANKDGVNIITTAVTADSEGAGYNWDDKVFVGEVVKFVRSGDPGMQLGTDPEMQETCNFN